MPPEETATPEAPATSASSSGEPMQPALESPSPAIETPAPAIEPVVPPEAPPTPAEASPARIRQAYRKRKRLLALRLSFVKDFGRARRGYGWHTTNNPNGAINGHFHFLRRITVKKIRSLKSHQMSRYPYNLSRLCQHQLLSSRNPNHNQQRVFR